MGENTKTPCNRCNGQGWFMVGHGELRGGEYCPDCDGTGHVVRPAPAPSDRPEPGEIRVLDGQRCRFIESELEGDKWEVLGPAETAAAEPARWEPTPVSGEQIAAMLQDLREATPRTPRVLMTNAVLESVLEEVQAWRVNRALELQTVRHVIERLSEAGLGHSATDLLVNVFRPQVSALEEALAGRHSAENCEACGAPLRDGDLIIPCEGSSDLHAACFGVEGELLVEGARIPVDPESQAADEDGAPPEPFVTVLCYGDVCTPERVLELLAEAKAFRDNPRRGFSMAELLVLTELAAVGDDSALSFKALSQRTGLDRADVQTACRGLRGQKLAQLLTGLMTEDGELYGSGYSITDYGALLAKELELAPDLRAAQ